MLQSSVHIKIVCSLLVALFVAAFGRAAWCAETVAIASPYGPMLADIFKPSGIGPFPVMIFSHGRAGDPAIRANMQHALREDDAAYWTHMGFVVVAPIRPGYGLGGGIDIESPGGAANCSSQPNYRWMADTAASGILATIDWVRQAPWSKPDTILLVGQSVGGLATVAAASQSPRGVIGYINFVGGSGGDPIHSPGRSCHPELLTDLYSSLGRKVRVPGLWFYASNDLFWGPNMPQLWGNAFNAHGGHADLVFTRASGSDGHQLMTDSPNYWHGKVEAFIRSRGM